MKYTILAAILTMSVFATPVGASEKPEHFPAVDSKDLKSAVCNLQGFSQALSNLTEQNEMSSLDMVKVHELTYTLEQAIAKLNEELLVVAADLEEVHLASERMEKETVKRYSDKYLMAVDQILKQTDCGITANSP